MSSDALCVRIRAARRQRVATCSAQGASMLQGRWNGRKVCSLLCDGERTALWHANERFCIHPPVRVDPELEKKGKSLNKCYILRYCSTKAKNIQVCPREPRAMPSLWWHLLPLAVPVHARAGVDVNGSHVILELSAPYPVGLARLSAPASRAVRGAPHRRSGGRPAAGQPRNHHH